MIDFTNGKFSAKALDFIRNSTTRLNIAHGSVRSSKTVDCSIRWLAYLFDGPPGDLFMLGKTTATLQRNVLNDIFDIIGPTNYHWVNKQQGELMLYHRRVYCYGANNEEAESKIRGATIAGAYCDEVSLYPQSVFNQLMARMSIKGAMCFCNTNPDNPMHWFYTDYICNDGIKNKRVWHFTMEDNPNLDQEYVTALKQMYRGVWYSRLIDGNWVAAEGLIYDMFSPELHMKDTNLILFPEKLDARLAPLAPKGVRWLVGCDYATASVMTWSLVAKLPNGVMLKVKEYYYDAIKEKAQKTDGEFITEFIQWIGVIQPWAIYCDPSSVSWKLELMRKNYRVINADNDVINGIRHVATKLSTNTFLIDHSCTNTKREYANYVWDQTAQLQGRDKPLKINDHTCDADRYVLYTDSIYGLSGVY